MQYTLFYSAEGRFLGLLRPLFCGKIREICIPVHAGNQHFLWSSDFSHTGRRGLNMLYWTPPLHYLTFPHHRFLAKIVRNNYIRTPFHTATVGGGGGDMSVSTEYTEWQQPLSGVHSIIMVKSTKTNGPPPFTLPTITNKVVVYAPAERADTVGILPGIFSSNRDNF